MAEKSVIKTRRVLPVLGVVLLALVITVQEQLPTLQNVYTVRDAACQHFFWMAQFKEKALFQNDLLTDFSKYMQHKGFLLLYWLVAYFMEPLFFSRVLPFLLIPSAAVLFFYFGRAASSTLQGLVIAALFLINPDIMGTFAGGVHRAFLYPFLALFLYFLVKKRFLKAVLSTVAAVFFYPPAALIMLFVYGLSFLTVKEGRLRVAWDKRKFLFLVGTLGVILFVSLATYRLSKAYSRFGPIASHKEIKDMPEFHKEGRVRALPRTNVLTRLQPSKNLFFLASGLFFLFIFRFKALRLPREAWYLLIAGVILCGLSIILHPLLYEPNRYLEPGLNLFLVFFLATNTSRCYHFLLRVPLNTQRRLVRLLGSFLLIGTVLFISYRNIERADYLGRFTQLSEENLNRLTIYYRIYCIALGAAALAAVIALLLVLKRVEAWLPNGSLAGTMLFIYLTIGATYNNHMEMRRTYFVTYPYPRLYKFLATLPKDSLLAGHPKLMDPVPLFSQRQVLLTHELSLPYFLGYYELIKKRTLNFFDAYYAEKGEKILDFAAIYKVDYLVMDSIHFNPGYLRRGNFYWQPFNSYIRKLALERKTFFLREPPSDATIFQYKTIYVLDIEKLLLECDKKNRRENK